jgi:PAS domain S-box-containing protein
MKDRVIKIKTFVEPALEVSELRYRRLFETAQDGILILDARTGAITDVNPFLIDMLGYSRDEFVDKKLWEVGAFKDIKASKDAFETLQNEKYIRYEDLPLKAKDGHLVQVEFVSNVYPVDGKEVIQCNIRNITERKQVEKKLLDSETRYRRLFETAKDGILILEAATGEIMDVNPFLKEMLGYSHTEFVGKQLWEIGLLKDILANKDAFLKLQEKGYTRYENLPLQTKDRRSIWVEFVSNTYPVDGKLIIQCNIRDITERKQAEKRAYEHEARYRLLFESASMGILLVDTEGKILEVSPAALQILGSPSAKATEEINLLTFRPLIEAGISADFQKVMDSAKPVIGEYPYTTKWGKSVFITLKFTPLFGANGNLEQIQVIMEDTTERKQAEARTAVSETELRSLFAAMTDAVMVLDADGRYIKIAPTNPINLYHSPDQMLGKTVHEVLPKEQADYIVAKTREAIQTDQVVPGKYALKIGGKEIWFASNATRLSENTAMWVAHDFTQRKSDEEALLHRAEIMNQVHEAIIVTDLKGLISEWNLGAETMFGYSAEEAVGKPISFIYEESQVSFLTEDIQPQVKRKGWNEIETRLRKKSGQVFPAHLLLAALKDSKGRITGFAGSALDITERKQAEQAIHQRFVELATLYASGLALSRLLSPKEIGQKLIELMGSEMNWHHTAIRLYHPEDESLELLAFNLPGARSIAESQEAEERLKSMISNAGEGLSGWAVQHQQNVRVGELSHDPRFVSVEPNIHSGMYIPLKVEDRVVGVISIESELPDAFSETDERLTATLANQAAIAFENARLHEETLHQLKQLQALHMIDETIAQSFDQRLMLDVLLTQTLSQLDAEAAAVFRVQFHHQQALEYVAGKGFTTHLIEMASLKLGNSIAGEAVATRKMVHVCEPEERGPQLLLAKLWLEEGFKCMDVMPLISKGEVKGVITVFHRKDFTPDPAWNSFLGTLAGQAAIAMDITQMFESLQRANMELSIAYEATIEGWSQAMDLRDKETEGHTLRVTEMSQRLGKAMQLGDEEINHMRRGALLHDIGKLGVPDSILFKPDKLTDEEWLVMRKHPEFAYDMLHSIAYLRDSMDIPYCHHEKWDGTGYPQGLKGDQIPLAARIFAVVDVWDALTSDRPYRKAWSKPDTLQYIREQSGKHFDPKVADVFLNDFVNE